MGNYEIKVNIEILETEKSTTNKPNGTEDGCFKLTICEQDAISIDKCENALLRTNYEAIRDALSKHLEEISKKKALEAINNGNLINNKHPFEVDGEVGRFSFQTHSIEKDGEKIYNTAASIFPSKRGKEKYKTSGFKELSMILGTTQDSYRETTFLINRMRHQKGATPVRTLQDNTEKEGIKILEFLEKKTKAILDKNNFTEDGKPKNTEDYGDQDVALVSEEEVKKAIEECGISAKKKDEIEKNPVCYESPTQTVNISLDFVEVKGQKEERSKKENPKSKQKKKCKMQ
jgi:hypothetical protein